MCELRFNLQTLCDICILSYYNKTIDLAKKKIYTLPVSYKKRATIAVELVAQPGILFLDEPTTGLDGGAALGCMQAVKKLVDTQNIAVICTIHQPSAEVFSLFNRILLLQEGGEMVYFGSVNDLMQYYKQNGLINSDSDNPADFAIEAMGGKNDTPNAVKLWAESQQALNLKKMLSNGVCPDTEKQEIKFISNYARSFWQQLIILVSKYWKFFTRDRIG